MNNISNQIMGVINQLAEKLGVAAEKVYPILQKQTQYHATMDICWIIGLSVILIACVILSIKLILDIKKNTYENQIEAIEFYPFILTLLVIGIIACSISLIACITELAQIKMNPDYYIFEMVKRLIN